MRKLLSLSLFLIWLLGFGLNANAQLYQGEYYNTYGFVTGIVESGNDMWIASWGGLVKHNKVTGADQYLNTLNSGLPYNKLSCMTKDTAGNIWIGTDGHGLCRFDGTTWTHWDTTNSAIPGNNITAMCYDQLNQSIWIGTLDGFVAKYDGINWQVFDSTDFGYPISYYGITAMAAGKNGIPWFGTYETGAFKYAGGIWKRYYSPTSVEKSINGIVVDTNDNLYFLTTISSHSKVMFYDYISWDTVHINPPFYNVSLSASIYLDHNQNLWVGTILSGLYKYDGNTTQHFTPVSSGLVSNEITAICEDASGKMYFGSSGNWSIIGTDFGHGMSEYDGLNFVTDSLTTSIHNYRVGGFALKKLGNSVMVCSEDGSFSAFDGISWHRTFPFYPNNSTTMEVREMSFNYLSDSLWIASGYPAPRLFTNNTFTSLNTIAGPIKAINAAQPGVLLYSSGTKILKVATPACNTYNVYDTLGGIDVVSITYDDKTGGYWLGTHGHGALQFDGQSFVIYDTATSPIPSNNINDIVIDEDGNKWMASADHGLLKLEGTTWTVFNTSNSGITDNRLNKLCFDNEEHLWIGTLKTGVIKYTGTYWTNFNTWNSPICHDEILKVASDSIGNIWVATPNGLSKITNGVWLQAHQQEKSIEVLIRPNPFIESTTIEFTLGNESKVSLDIYNAFGQRLACLYSGSLSAGPQRFVWNGSADKEETLPVGIYFVRLNSEYGSSSYKVVKVK